jgi:phosphopantothenoylcysteine decarboxylase/phosphopantothenate--cysteine ligase
MGYAIARAAEKRGGQVTLISGPVTLEPPVNVECIDVVNCEEMAGQMLSHLDGTDI